MFLPDVLDRAAGVLERPVRAGSRCMVDRDTVPLGQPPGRAGGQTGRGPAVGQRRPSGCTRTRDEHWQATRARRAPVPSVTSVPADGPVCGHSPAARSSRWPHTFGMTSAGQGSQHAATGPIAAWRFMWRTGGHRWWSPVCRVRQTPVGRGAVGVRGSGRCRRWPRLTEHLAVHSCTAPPAGSPRRAAGAQPRGETRWHGCTHAAADWRRLGPWHPLHGPDATHRPTPSLEKDPA